MTVRDAVQRGADRLRDAVETPQLDALLLLSHAAGWAKERTLASFPESLSPAVSSLFETYVALRLRGIPVSYLRRRKEFYGLEFAVDETVLVPRPETELLVETVLKLAAGNRRFTRVLDCCTGSGCIAVSIKNERPDLTVWGSDLSKPAISVFVRNAQSILGTALPFIHSDLLDSVEGSFDVIVSNPPYLTSAETDAMASQGWPEPRVALDGGQDGLRVIERLVRQAGSRLSADGCLLLEAAPTQMEHITRFFVQNSYQDITIVQDLSGRSRAIYGYHESSY